MEKEKEKEDKNIYHLCPIHTPADQGSNPKSSYVPWLGIKLTTFWCAEWHSNQLKHLARIKSSIDCFGGDTPKIKFRINSEELKHRLIQIHKSFNRRNIYTGKTAALPVVASLELSTPSQNPLFL